MKDIRSWGEGSKHPLKTQSRIHTHPYPAALGREQTGGSLRLACWLASLQNSKLQVEREALSQKQNVSITGRGIKKDIDINPWLLQSLT